MESSSDDRMVPRKEKPRDIEPRKKIKMRTKIILASLLIAAAVWVFSGAFSIHYEVVTSWFQKEEPTLRYKFPPFDEQRWRRVLAEQEKQYAENRPPANPNSKRFQLVSTATELSNRNRPPTGKRSEFWSFRLLDSPQVPELANDSWVKNPIDAFVLREMQQRGFQPAAQADDWSLARRIWLDLTGMPPTPEQINKFVNDGSRVKYEETIEVLLEDKAFGEHWASHWLDLARYADSNGYELDELKPYAFPYRDFVIWAMNEDVGFDQFLQWQIAGDLIEPENPLAVAATGFFTNAPINNFLPQESERYEELADQVSTFGRAMLGLTIGCARCHDHFYDPISHAEYHRLVAILKDTKRELKYLTPDQGQAYLKSGGKEYEAAKKEKTQMLLNSIKEANIAELDFSWSEKELLRQPIDPDNEEQALLLSKCMRCLMVDENDIADDTKPLWKDRQRYNQLDSLMKKLKPKLEPLPPMGLTLSGDEISLMPILKGGKVGQEGRNVGPGFLTELTTGMPDFESNQWENWSDSPRIALANWVVDTREGAGALAARVIVNRLWQHHFGRGLVTTPSDFGTMGNDPTHPELLEWLAVELVQNNWSLKHIHRLIVTSATYRQSTQPSPGSLTADPENNWLSRQNQVRMTAESLRDSVLVCCGTLNDEIYGRPVFPQIPSEAIFATQDEPEHVWPLYTSTADDRRRRSIYLVKKRTIPIPFLNLFDMPDASFSCEKRSRSVVPTQALVMLNSPFFKKNAVKLADRLVNQYKTKEQLIEQAYLIVLNRHPDKIEMETCSEFLQHQTDRPMSTVRVIDLVHTLFMTNEFIYRN